MTLVNIVRIAHNKLKWLIIFPLVLTFFVAIFTRNIQREYVSSTTVYTGLASGYDLADDGTKKVDNAAVNFAFDNLINTVKSRESIEETAIKLLAQHLLLEAPNQDILDEKGFKDLSQLVPKGERYKLVVAGDFDKTVNKIYAIKDSSNKNMVVDLLTMPGTFYNTEELLANLKVSRKQSSDMLEIIYTTTDPGVCQHTLKFLLNSFSHRYRGLKSSESVSVVKYFEDELANSFKQLQSSENELKNFGVEHKIINYDEQTKYVAESKETMNSEYYHERMKFEASQKAMKRIEEKMNNYVDFVSINEDIVTLRQDLSNLTFKLANASIYNYSSEKIDKMHDDLERLKLKIKEKARAYYDFNNSIEWVPQNTLLNEWLTKLVEMEESKARLKVYEEGMKKYESVYSDYAPLGSMLNQKNREVDVAEKQYMATLHGLNLAKLKQQSLQMGNELSVVDHPFYPQRPQPSKRLFLILLSFFAGFLILLSYNVLLEFLNFSIRNPSQVEKSMGLPLLGALPDIGLTTNYEVKVDEIKESMMQQTLARIFADIRCFSKTESGYLISIFSTKNEDGKTFFSEELCGKLIGMGKSVLYLYPETSTGHSKFANNIHEKMMRVPYPISDNILDYENISDLVGSDYNVNLKDVDFTILEIPDMAKFAIPLNLIAKTHLSILVLHANKYWLSADRFILDTYLKVALNSIKVVLNFVTPDFLEPVYGEIPKKRSWLRRGVKSALKGYIN